METINKIGLRIKTINNLIKRKLDNNDTFREIVRMTGINAWLIAYVDSKNRQGIPVFQKDIEEHFCITRSCVSKVLKLMEEKGMVTREPVNHDARLKRLVLTKKAEAMATQLKSDVDCMEGDLVAGFSNEELAQLVEYLDRMENNIQKSLNENGNIRNRNISKEEQK